MVGKPLIEVLFEESAVANQPKKRGGSHSARERGDIGIVVHVSPAEHAELKRAADVAGKTLKQFCKDAALSAVRHPTS
jgi:hypothetical protein